MQYLGSRELINEAYSHVDDSMPQDDPPSLEKASILAQLAIASALDDIARSFDLTGIDDGVKQLAVELGSLTLKVGD